MGREVRMVPANWEHPKQANGKYKPMFASSYSEAFLEWKEEKGKWEAGIYPEYASEESKKLSYEEWNGEAPDPEYYMPQFKPEEKTHYMMYENTSEGTPISPAFTSKEELAHWLADNGASAFGRETATYEQWLSTINRGWAISAVATSEGIQSGVVALAKDS